jgi:hypothetical protein
MRAAWVDRVASRTLKAYIHFCLITAYQLCQHAPEPLANAPPGAWASDSASHGRCGSRGWTVRLMRDVPTPPRERAADLPHGNIVVAESQPEPYRDVVELGQRRTSRPVPEQGQPELQLVFAPGRIAAATPSQAHLRRLVDQPTLYPVEELAMGGMQPFGDREVNHRLARVSLRI